ncbi:MAG: tRNA (adenosine(37)-N6)-dimethylallyltransferase MiaA [Treponema sp.]|nr:tRNA (adenosine(37)-N6)-dimethylallyltransferase MiaA [Treponema sp.]
MASSIPPILVPVLFGPTASGKTGVLFRLFGPGGLCSLNAEIVSADSMQVYRGMDIGTAKPSAQEMARLPHHLIDIRDPSEQFNVGDFVRLALDAIADIAGRGAIPVISGGTGFYLKNLVLGLPEAPPSDAAIRDTLKLELREKGAAVLMDELARFDPISAERIHLNDEYRLLRALEVLRLSGRPLSSFDMQPADADNETRNRYRFAVFGLFRPKEELYRRIDERCAAMFSQGLPDEVHRLHESGYTPRDPGLRAIGYREFFIEDEPAEDGSSGLLPVGDTSYRLSHDLAGVQELIARNCRRYAKRQITFFASLPGARRIMAGGDDDETAWMLWRELESLFR